MHEVQTTAIDDPRCLSVCLLRSIMWLYCSNTAEQIEVLYGLETLGDPSIIVLHGRLIFPHRFNAAFATLASCVL